MKDESSDTLSFSGIGAMLRRHLGSVVLAVASFAAVAFLLAMYLPQRYKSKAVLNIQSGYFQHPLVSDLMSEVHDPGELSAQRLSLLRLALSQEFLDMLGTKYKIYIHPDDPSFRVLDRERFLKRIEYFSVSPTSFQVSIIAHQPRTAYSITKEVLSQMTYTLIEQRYQNLMKARDAILKQAKLLNKSLVTNTNLPLRETLEAQLKQMEGNLAALRTRFTESHPEVLKTVGRAKELKGQIERLPAETDKSVDDYARVFLSPAARVSTQQIYDDLLKKLSHLNIVLEMERDRENVSYLAVIEEPVIPTRPFFPNRAQFALLGALCGMLFGGIRMTFTELKRLNDLDPRDAPLLLDVEFLGELPRLVDREKLLFIEGSKKNVIPLRLPHG